MKKKSKQQKEIERRKKYAKQMFSSPYKQLDVSGNITKGK